MDHRYIVRTTLDIDECWIRSHDEEGKKKTTTYTHFDVYICGVSYEKPSQIVSVFGKKVKWFHCFRAKLRHEQNECVSLSVCVLCLCKCDEIWTKWNVYFFNKGYVLLNHRLLFWAWRLYVDVSIVLRCDAMARQFSVEFNLVFGLQIQNSCLIPCSWYFLN